MAQAGSAPESAAQEERSETEQVEASVNIESLHGVAQVEKRAERREEPEKTGRGLLDFFLPIGGAFLLGQNV